MKNLFYTITFALAVLACGPAKTTDDTATKTEGNPLDKAETAVMAVHDEVMPQVETMLKLKKQINARVMKLDSLEATPTERVRADEEQAQGRLIVRRLTEADSLMMDWMSQYKGDTLKKLPEADALRYLDGQQKKVDDVKAKINQSIEQAKTYLNAQPTNSNIRKEVGLKSFHTPRSLQILLSSNGIGQFKEWHGDEIGWTSSTDYYKFGSSDSKNGMYNNLAYYLESDKQEYVKRVKIVLNINNKLEKKQALDKYMDMINSTFKSLSIDLPRDMSVAIKSQREFHSTEPNYIITNVHQRSNIDTWKLIIETK